MVFLGWWFWLLMVADGTCCEYGLARSSTPARDNIIYGHLPKWTVQEWPKRGHRTLRGQVLVTRARAVPVLGLFGDGLGTVWGMVSSATRQTPQIDDNTTARGGIVMYNGGLAGG